MVLMSRAPRLGQYHRLSGGEALGSAQVDGLGQLGEFVGHRSPQLRQGRLLARVACGQLAQCCQVRVDGRYGLLIRGQVGLLSGDDIAPLTGLSVREQAQHPVDAFQHLPGASHRRPVPALAANLPIRTAPTTRSVMTASTNPAVSSRPTVHRRAGCRPFERCAGFAAAPWGRVSSAVVGNPSALHLRLPAQPRSLVAGRPTRVTARRCPSRTPPRQTVIERRRRTLEPTSHPRRRRGRGPDSALSDGCTSTTITVTTGPSAAAVGAHPATQPGDRRVGPVAGGSAPQRAHPKPAVLGQPGQRHAVEVPAQQRCLCLPGPAARPSPDPRLDPTASVNVRRRPRRRPLVLAVVPSGPAVASPLTTSSVPRPKGRRSGCRCCANALWLQTVTTVRGFGP